MRSLSWGLALLCSLATQASAEPPVAPSPARAQAVPTDAYGGDSLYHSRATGFFRIEKGANGRWWFITPAGNAFFANGLDVIQPTWKAKRGFQKRYHGDRKLWAEDSIRWLRSTGMNVIGPDHFDRHYEWLRPLIQAEPRVPYTLVFAPQRPIPSPQPGMGRKHAFPDVFSARFERQSRRAAQRIAEPLANDPYLLGYFFHNELGWGLFGPFSGLWADHIRLGRDSPGKQAWLELMKARYGGEIAAFRRAYGSPEAILEHNHYLNDHLEEVRVPRAVREQVRQAFQKRKPQLNTWEDVAAFTDAQLLEQAVRLSPRIRSDVEAFLRVISDRYHGVMAEALRAADPNHLLLGSKFIGGTPLALPNTVLQGAAPHVDLFAHNAYFLPSSRGAQRQLAFMERCTKVTGKPILLSEWGGFHGQDVARCSCYVPVPTQLARARAYREGMQMLARKPWLIGVFFYSYADHARVNWGVVDSELKPYPELTQAIQEVAPNLTRWHAGRDSGLLQPTR
jgi:agarase